MSQRTSGSSRSSHDADNVAPAVSHVCTKCLLDDPSDIDALLKYILAMQPSIMMANPRFGHPSPSLWPTLILAIHHFGQPSLWPSISLANPQANVHFGQLPCWPFLTLANTLAFTSANFHFGQLSFWPALTLACPQSGHPSFWPALTSTGTYRELSHSLHAQPFGSIHPSCRIMLLAELKQSAGAHVHATCPVLLMMARLMLPMSRAVEGHLHTPLVKNGLLQ